MKKETRKGFVINVVIGVIMLVVGMVVGPLYEAWWETTPENRLDDAEAFRKRMTPESLNKAIALYRDLLDVPRVEAEALRGMSRSYTSSPRASSTARSRPWRALGWSPSTSFRQWHAGPVETRLGRQLIELWRQQEAVVTSTPLAMPPVL